MVKDCRRLWKDVTSTNDEGGAVRILARIVLDKEGRAFISSLERNDAELCIEILDRVSHGLCLLPPFTLSDGFFRASECKTSEPRRSRVEEAC